jgi:hypothetical protein
MSLSARICVIFSRYSRALHHVRDGRVDEHQRDRGEGDRPALLAAAPGRQGDGVTAKSVTGRGPTACLAALIRRQRSKWPPVPVVVAGAMPGAVAALVVGRWLGRDM